MFSFQTCDLAIKSKNLKIKYLFQFSNSKSFFQNFIKYHDYGYSYQDGTLPMLKKKLKNVLIQQQIHLGKNQMMLLTK